MNRQLRVAARNWTKNIDKLKGALCVGGSSNFRSFGVCRIPMKFQSQLWRSNVGKLWNLVAKFVRLASQIVQLAAAGAEKEWKRSMTFHNRKGLFKRKQLGSGWAKARFLFMNSFFVWMQKLPTLQIEDWWKTWELFLFGQCPALKELKLSWLTQIRIYFCAHKRQLKLKVDFSWGEGICSRKNIFIVRRTSAVIELWRSDFCGDRTQFLHVLLFQHLVVSLHDPK